LYGSFAIDNQQHKLADVLSGLLAATQGSPFDVGTACQPERMAVADSAVSEQRLTETP